MIVSVRFDTTLLAYYLGRAQGVETDWRTLEPLAGESPPPVRVLGYTFVPLLASHDLPADPRAFARARFLEAIEGGALFVARDPYADFTSDLVAQRCNLLGEAGTARLHACR